MTFVRHSKIKLLQIKLFQLIFLLTILNLLFFQLWAEEDKIDEAERILFETEERIYVDLAPSYSEDIKEVFANYPIHTNLSFIVANATDKVLDKMFVDLVFTARAARQYARSPYIVEDKVTHYFTQIPDLVEGEINIIYKDPKENRYLYLVQGFYDTFVTLRGKMIVDVKYVIKGSFVQFYVKSYVIVTNSVLWRFARYLKSYPSFQKKIDTVFDKNVRYTISLGKRTVYGIQSNLRKSNY